MFLDKLFCTVGCHPTRCDEFNEAVSPEAYLNSLTDVIKNNRSKVIAIGECGLDNQRLHFCSKEVQEKYVLWIIMSKICMKMICEIFV